jgi:hypothetical protein
LLIIEDAVFQFSIPAKTIAGKEDPAAFFIGHDGLRPVHHGGGKEAQGMAAQADGFIICDGLKVFVDPEEGCQHIARFFAAQNGDLRGDLQQFSDCTGVVGFHVVYHQISELARIDAGLDVFHQQCAGAVFAQVDQGAFFILDQITVV